MSELTDFRRAVSTLKKQGLLPDRNDAGVKLDARSALPSMKVGKRRLDTIVKKFDDVVSGKATAFKVTPEQLRHYQRAGFETPQGRKSIRTSGDFIIVPHAATEKATLSKGAVHLKSKQGIERVQIPVPFENVKQWTRDVKKNAKAINALKGQREYFGIRFFGGQRANFYSDIRDLINDLERYETIQTHTGYKQEELYKHIEILRINTRGARKVEESVERRRTLKTREYNLEHSRKEREKIRKNPERKRKYNAAAAERASKYRARIKRDKRKAAHARRMNRERQARYQAKQKKLKKKGRKK